MTARIPLNDGNTIPQLGFGTGQMTPDETVDAVAHAIATGYRHVDTAQMYGNERAVGEGIRRSGIDRDEVFITSKLDNRFHRPADARASFERTLDALEVERIDLFLIHWPVPMLFGGGYDETWYALEEFRQEGLSASIGVSNFQPEHLERLREESGTVPAVNQVELHPEFQNRVVRAYNDQHGIVTEAWSPIAEARVLARDEIKEVARRHRRSPAQVVLRWHLQRGNVIFPKSSDHRRIEENFSIFDFELDHGDLATIDALDRGEEGRIGEHPDSMDEVSG